MRIRTTKPEFWASESIGRLDRDTRLLFIGLWSLADDHGRFRAHPKFVAGQLFPYDSDGPAIVSRGLASLSAEGCLDLYAVGGTQYGYVTGWERHQKVDKRSASRLPAPEDAQPTRNTQTPRLPPIPREDSAESREESVLDLVPSTLDLVPRSKELGPENAVAKSPPVRLQVAAPPPPTPPAPPPKEPDKVKPTTTPEGWWSHAQDRREQTTGLIREEPPRGLGFWFSEAMGHVGGDEQRLLAGYEAFLVDPFWRNEAKARCAWAGWVKQWRQFVPGTAPPVRLASKRGAPVPAEAVDWAQVSLGEVEL